MRRAFAAGLSVFADARIESLPAAANDARELFALFTDAALGEADPVFSTLVLSPTRAALREKLGAFFAALAPHDEFILFISGHAAHLPSGRLAFSCHDTDPARLTLTAFGEEDLRALILSRPDCRGIVILDTCFAGTFAQVQNAVRTRGTQDGARIEPAREGVEIVLACGSREQAFEDGRSGFFSRLLAEALRSGARLPANKAHLSAMDAVNWIRAQLKAAHLDQAFWPSVRAAGDVTGLFLARNPHFNQAPAAAPAEDALARELARVMGRLRERSQDAHGRLARIAEAAMRAGRLPANERGVLLYPARDEIFKSGLGCAFLFPLLFAAMFNPLETFWYWFGGFATLCVSFTVFVIYKDLKNRRRSGLLITPDGFCQAHAGDGNVTRLEVVPWESITAFERYVVVGQGAKNLLTITHQRGRIEYNDSENFTGGVDRVHAEMQQYRAQVDVLVFPDEAAEVAAATPSAETASPAPARRVSRIMAAGCGNYAALSALQSPARDVAAISAAWAKAGVPGSPARLDPDLAEFEQWLGGEFAPAAGEIRVLYFSGHGLLAGGELYLALRDTDPARASLTAFPVRKFYDLAQEARLGHLILILDTCYSGGGGASLGLSARTSFRELFEGDRHVITFLAAATDQQMALAPLGGVSVFTQALVEAIAGAADGGEPVTLDRLSTEVTRRLDATGLGQVHWRFSGESAGEIVLFGATVAPAPTATVRGHVDEIKWRQLEQLEQYAKKAQSAGRDPAAAPAAQILRDGGDQVVAHLFQRGKHTAEKPQGGCFFAVFFAIIPLPFTANMEPGPGRIAVWIAAPVGAALWYRWVSRPTITPPGFLLVSDAGIVLDGVCTPMVEIGAMELQQDGISGRQTLVLTGTVGLRRILADSEHPWSTPLDQIAHVVQEYKRISRQAELDELRNKVTKPPSEKPSAS